MNVKTTTPTNPVRDALCAARTAEAGARDAFLAATTRADQDAACRAQAAACDATNTAQAAYDTGRAAAMTALMADLFGPAAA